jgi:hypothetical protein
LVLYAARTLGKLGRLFPHAPLIVKAAAVAITQVLVVLFLLGVHPVPHPRQKPHDLLRGPARVHVFQDFSLLKSNVVIDQSVEFTYVLAEKKIGRQWPLREVDAHGRMVSYAGCGQDRY